MDAGSITIRIKGDMTDLQTALDKMNAKLDNTKKSSNDVFMGLVKFETLKSIFTSVTGALFDFGKFAISSASSVENLNASFKTMLGSADKARALTAELRKLAAATPFGTEDLAKATQTMLAFGINSNDVINNLTMLGDVAGNSKEKLSSLALVFGQISSAGKLQGQDLLQLINVGFNPLQILAEKTGKSMNVLRDEMAKGQIGIDQVKEAFKIATSEGGIFYKNMETQSQTLTGKISTMQDEYTNLSSVIGTALLPTLKSMTEEATAFATSLSEFVKSTEGINLLSTIIGNAVATFSLLKTVAVELGQNIKTYLSSIIETLSKNMKSLFGETNKTNPAMLVLSSIVNYIGLGMAISAKMINLVVTAMVDFINIVKSAGNLTLSFWTMMANPFDEKRRNNFMDQLGKYKDSFGTLFSNLSTNIGDMVAETTKQFSNLGKNVVSDADKWTEQYKNVLKKTADGVTNAISDLSGGGGEITSSNTSTTSNTPTAKPSSKGIEIKLNTNALEESLNVVSSALGKISNSISKAVSDGVSEVSTAWADMGKVMDDAAATATEKGASVMKVIAAVANAVGQAALSIMNAVGQAMSDSISKQLDDVQKQHDSEIKMIEDKLALETELIENDGKTKAEKRDADIATLEEQALTETDIKKKADLEQQISALNKEKQIEDAKLKADKEKAKSDYKLAKASYDLQKQQFEINQAMQIVQATIAYALGLVQLWANVWSVGPVAGAVLGGIMTGVMTGIYAAQVALIASSKFPGTAPTPPAFATGTSNFRGGRAIVGEMGAEEVELPAGANVNPAGMTGWNSQQVINLIVDGEVLRTWQIQNQRSESLY